MAFIFSAAALIYPGHGGNEERRYKYSIIAISSGGVVSQRKFKNLHAKVCLRQHKWGFPVAHRVQRVEATYCLPTGGTYVRNIFLISSMLLPATVSSTQLFPHPQQLCKFYYSRMRVCADLLRHIDAANTAPAVRLPYKQKRGIYVFGAVRQHAALSYVYSVGLTTSTRKTRG